MRMATRGREALLIWMGKAVVLRPLRHRITQICHSLWVDFGNHMEGRPIRRRQSALYILIAKVVCRWSETTASTV